MNEHVLNRSTGNEALKLHIEINLDAFKHKEQKTQLEVA